MNRSVGVVITAAGRSARFGGDKLSARIGDSSVLARSIHAFIGIAGVVEIVVAISPDLPFDSELGREIDSLRRSLGDAVRFIAVGGASRAETVANAARSLGDHCSLIAIHDGARPLVSRELIEHVLAAANEHGAAAPALPVTATIKQAAAPLPARVERTVPRASLWAMQTPQVMKRSVLLDAIARCPLPLGQVTDDVQLLELIGEPVMLVAGEERNLKITTKLDLELARLSLHLEGVAP